MRRKVVTAWLCSAIMFSFIVIMVEIAPTVEAPIIIYVDDSNTSPPWLGTPGDPYQYIQDGIDAAISGDTVFVKSGTYVENVVVNKTINLTGEDRDTTIIDGDWNGDVVNVSSDLVNITGFTVITGGVWGAGIELYFVQNCRIYDNIAGSNNWEDIHLSSSSNNTITNNTVSNMGYGIYLEYSNNNTITNNTASNTYCGIYVYYSNNNTITNNNASKNDGDGIYFRYSNNNIVVNNTLSSNIDGGAGIDLYQSTNNTITGNTISNNDADGIHLRYSSSNIIINNTVSSNNELGIQLYQSSNNTITGNNISLNIWYGILLRESSNNNTINNNKVTNNEHGIELYKSSNTIITNNNISSNNEYGVSISSSSNNTITNNNASNNDFGIYLTESSRNTIINNNITSNIGWGIELGESSNNTITGNNISSNNGYGFYLHNSRSNAITNNTVSSNIDHGFFLESSLNNKIYHNNIIGNTNQAYDDSVSGNQWDNGFPLGGNYWSNYGGVDLNTTPYQNVPPSDGLGDTPYVIDADSQDNYPLMEPYTSRTFENYTILKQGWNLISIPLIQEDQILTSVFKMIDGYYDTVRFYDSSDTTDPWKQIKTDKSFGNDLTELNETMGFWIHVTRPGDTIFLYNGTTPTTSQQIQLYKGWNLVGYPSLTSYNRTDGLNNTEFGTHINKIMWFNATTKTWHSMEETDYFHKGVGYWIHAREDVVWNVPL